MFSSRQVGWIGRAVLALVVAVGASHASAQCVSLTTLGSAYTQNFDTLSNTAGSTTNNLTIPGWFMTETGGGARDNEQYGVDTGASTTGDTYSYGAAAATERALGGLQSGTLIPNFGSCYTNNTGSTITQLALAYTGEEWRLGTAARTDQLNLEYSLNATDLVTGTWTNVAALNFVTPDTATTGAKNGNAAADRTALSSNVTGLSIANGATFWIRWTDVNASGADDGLAVDDFSLTPQAVALPNLTINDVSLNEGNAGTTSFTFTVSLSAPAGAGGVTFDITSADGTATQPSDYATNSLTGQTIPAGSSTYSFTVLVNGDTAPETNETFFVNVTNVSGAIVTDGQGQGSIVNDDVAPNLTINDVSLNEGNSGTTSFTFTVSLSAPAPAGGTTFDIATADGTATQPSDYTQKSLTAQTIPAGSSTYSFTVLVNGDATPEASETFFVNVTNVTNAIVTDGQGLGTISNDDFNAIHDIQGNGATSPLVGQSIVTQGIVTATKNNGFFLQEPDATVDADPATSEGIFVFTSSAPPGSAAVGNRVQVTATVAEFVPTADPMQPPVTELTAPTVALISAGNPLPAPVPLTASFPSPSGVFDQLERIEGMRVAVAAMTVVAPTGGGITEASATSASNGVFFGTVTGLARPFREPGIQQPDTVPPGSSIPPIPRWDANPELIRVDSDVQPGTTAVNVSTGATFNNVVGVLDYTFRHYTVYPDVTMVPATAGISPTPATAPTTQEFTVASENLQRFFDTVDDPAIGEPILTTTAFNNRLVKASFTIRNFLQAPDVIGVEEVENLSTLQAIATQVNNDAVAAAQPNPNYTAFLVEGNDVGGIDVGFLVKTATVFGSTPRVEVVSVTQLSKNTLFTNPDTTTALLNDRPPLQLKAIIHHPNGASFPVTVIVNHLRSLNGMDDDVTPGAGGWPTEGARIRAKRYQQAVDLANIVQSIQTTAPTERVILVGDFNAFEFNDGYVDSIGTILGNPAPDSLTVVTGDGADLVNPNLINLFTTPPATERYSYTFDGSAQSLDHIIVNAPLINATLAFREEHPRVNADFPETARNSAATPTRLSDHDPVLSYYRVQGFQTADLSVTVTDAPDPVVAGANLTYTITVANAGPDAATTAAFADTLPVGTTFVSLASAAGWTCTTPAVGATGTVNCSNPSAAVGSSTFTLVVQVASSVASGTVLTDTATATTVVTDPAPGNNTGSTTTTVSTSADLSVTLTDTPDPVLAGAVITYTMTVANAGVSDAASVSLSDTLPAGTSFASITAAAGWNCTTPAVGATGTVNCTIAGLPAAGNASFTLGVTVAAATANGTVISDTATVSAATTDPTPANNSATTTTTVVTSADISVTLTDAPDPAVAGGNLVYTIVVSNTGPNPAVNATLADTLPAGTTFVSLPAVAGWTCTTPAVGAGGAVNCSNASFPAGTATFTLTVQVAGATAPGTVLTDTATVATSTPDAMTGNNSATTTTTVSSPATLSATKTISYLVTPNPGTAITYTIVIRNTGAAVQNDNAGNEFTDVLPAALTLVSASATSGTAVATVGTNTVTWNGSIAAGATVTITIQATIKTSATAGQTISNQASLAFDADGNGSNESTALTDDPSVGGAADTTSFVVQQAAATGAAIPALSPAQLLLLALLLAGVGLVAVGRRAD